jgi:Bacterial tandem repeat domain 1
VSISYAGAWRAGTDGHYLWAGVDWANFNAKWNELSGQGFRLSRITTFLDGGQRRYTGVWRAGSGGHYLWAGVDWANFTGKFNELSGQGLRLVDIKPYVDGHDVKWIGVWREGTDGHYLWAAEWASFQAKFNELSGQGLRLVAIDSYMSGSTRMWAGAWRAGTDGHYLWAGVDWNSFTAKWSELAGQGLRLADIATYLEGGHRKWAGIWRQGADGYLLWSAPDVENFLGQWNESAKSGLRLVGIEAMDASCQGDCCNHVVSHDASGGPAPYVYGVTGDPGGPYRWPVDDNEYVRVSALNFSGQPFTLPFNDHQVVHFGTWIYQAPPGGNYHHAIDYLRPNDWHTFEVRAAAPGKVVFVGWDNWSGNTIIISHDVDGVADSFRTIYMHLRDGPQHDINAAWNNTVPTLSGDTLTNYKKYLNNTGGAQDPAQRNPDANYWGTEAHAISATLIGKAVAAGEHIAWAGCTGPGGCGCTKSMPSHPNTHLHIFFCRRDPSDGNWYFIDPYGVYSYPAAGYPPGVTDTATGPCVRYSVAWKGGHPQYP